MKVFLRILAVLLFIFGGLLLLGFSIELVEGTSEESLAFDITMAVIFGLGPIIGGIFLWKAGSKKRRKYSTHKQETILLKIAQQKNGMLSVADVAIALEMTTEDAKHLIDKLYYKGVFELQITDNGATLYKLVNFSSDEDRSTAKPL